MEKELLASIYKDITARASWADRQAVWYEMRRDGLRRRNKPFPGAADTHFPLIDSVIEKFKPFYINQLFATERLADFISKNPQAGDRMTDVAWWFDYKLKQHSNLEREIPFVIDSMLQNGRGICKAVWCADEKKIRFEIVQPIYLIVPVDTESLQSADRIVHVQHFSTARYANGEGAENRKQGAEFLKRITGGQTDAEAQRLQDVKQRKEGITNSSREDLIIIWEVYEKTKEGWNLYTISPACPDEDVRPMLKLPYKHGFAPFVDFAMEETDKSYYSPRGVAEILAPFESSLCKMWNEKHDAMTFYNRPLFYTARDVPNAGNIRMKPGDILPFEIKPVERGAPPMSWDQEMINTRMVAEQRIAVPDFGTGQQINTSERKTAREIDAIQGAMSSIVDMRSRAFRRQLGELYNQVWALLLQYDADLDFLDAGQVRKLDPAARDEVMTLRPNGSSDAWNQHGRLTKAISRKQLLGQSPFINQGELDKSILELDEPGLVARLYRDPGIAQQDQVARIMRDIPALEMGLNVEPRPDDDDAIQASFLMEYIARNGQQQQQVDPVAMQAMQTRLAAHMERLNQSNPQAARELQAKGKQIAQSLFALEAQQQGQQPQQREAA